MNNYQYWINKNINRANFLGKNVFITGGNSGIGLELAKQCASLGSNLFLLCRNQTRAEQALNSIKEEFPNTQIKTISLDLSSLKSIENAVKEISKYRIDIFVHNAGVYHLPKGSKTSDGFEIVMGTNYLGTQYLTNLLLPILEKQTNSSTLLFETSITSKLVKPNLADFFGDQNYNSMIQYGRSKLSINCLYESLLDKYSSKNKINFVLAHPGATYTPLIVKGYRNKVFQASARAFMKLAFHSPSKASLTLLKGIDYQSNIKVGPRSIFGLSGYPKKWRTKKIKKYLDVVSLGNSIIDTKLKEISNGK